MKVGAGGGVTAGDATTSAKLGAAAICAPAIPGANEDGVLSMADWRAVSTAIGFIVAAAAPGLKVVAP